MKKRKGQSAAGWFYSTSFRAQDACTCGGMTNQCDGCGRCCRPERCADCGEEGERTGHQTCQYPQDHR